MPIEILTQPSRPLHGEDLSALKSGVDELVFQFLRPVKVRGGEIIWVPGQVAMLAACQVVHQNLEKQRVSDEVPGQPIQQRGKPGNRGGHERPALLENPVGFPKSGDPLGAFGQMIERAQEQITIGRPVAAVEHPGVAYMRFEQGPARLRNSCIRLLDVHGCQVEQVHVIPALGERECVHAGRAPPTSRIVAGGWGRNRSRISSIRSRSSRPIPEVSRSDSDPAV